MTTTLPQTGTVSPASRLRDFATRTPNAIALREKSRGIWREFTWAQFWDQAETFAHALLAHDIGRGDRVAIHSDNRPEWLFTDLGSLAAGAACMGLYPTNPTAEVEYLLNNSGARLLVVEDEEQADKVLAIATSDLPMLERIIYLEHRGVDAYDDPRLMSWDAFMEAGRAHRTAHPEAVAARMAEAKPEDLAYLVYTSGTTGPPKGSMITLANLDFATREIAGDEGIVQPGPGPDDLIVSYLPLCHIYEKLFSVVFNTGKKSVKGRNLARHRHARRAADDRAGSAADLGADPCRHPGPARLGVAPQADQRRHLDDVGALRRQHVGAAEGPAYPPQPGADPDRQPVPVPIPQGPGGFAAGSLRCVGGGADRPGDPAVLHVDRRAAVRGLRDDRELRRRHHQSSDGSSSARSASPTPVRTARSGDRRDSHQRPAVCVLEHEPADIIPRWKHTGDVRGWTGPASRSSTRIIIIACSGRTCPPVENTQVAAFIRRRSSC
jgi:hypothetical protein